MPHLKELVKLHEGSPFAVVGVNTGDGPEAFRRGMKEHQLPWISAFQGKEAPIAEHTAAISSSTDRVSSSVEYQPETKTMP